MDHVEYGKPVHTERQIGCTRCHGPGHDDLTYRPLTHFIEFTNDSSIATHWRPCPTNGEPILLCVTSSEDVYRLEYEQSVARAEAKP